MLALGDLYWRQMAEVYSRGIQELYGRYTAEVYGRYVKRYGRHWHAPWLGGALYAAGLGDTHPILQQALWVHLHGTCEIKARHAGICGVAAVWSRH